MTDVLTLDSAGRVIEVEGKTLEFKRDLSSPTKPLRTVAAFANSAGGRLVIGVNDDGSVFGVEDPLAEEERITSLITDRISPQLVPGIDLVTLGGATVLVVDVPLSTRRPHFMKDQGPEFGVYVRLGSSTRQADPALVAELERNARGVAFEDLSEPRATLDDLDLEGLSELRGRQTGVDDLIALGLAVKQGGEVVPTNAGILAACDDPTRFLPSAWVQCGRLRGPSGTDIFDQTEVHGPMPRAVDKVMEFLLKHAFKTAVFGEVKRRDVYSIPVEAIREVVVNALVHANYAERGTPIRVGFYDDRIQVDSPGLLLPGMTVESMRRASRLRNPSLARIFREAGIMEQWGTGVQRVFEQIAEAGLPEPRIEEVMDRLRFTVYVPSHAPEGSSATGEYQGNAPSEQGVSKLSEQVSKMSEQAQALLGLASEGPRSRAELLAGIDLSDAYGNYKRHLLPLIEGGYLARTIPEKPNSQNQRYRTTDAGREILAGKEITK
ncbi:helix-turn-helix domain-containing protein [Propionibacterium freudenreichii]|uniref:AlbA family DNA-binding domain-containing protein n=1 Tax=Propionibacterium freudenreichii TaxID=1744 RepID=UPI0005433831|nr:helix-turn-helix domain-containing protein [Propionibacterium freudenreichii]CEG97300.1 ATP-dependent DNA helicase [Propionibacterium freudenreichii]